MSFMVPILRKSRIDRGYFELFQGDPEFLVPHPKAKEGFPHPDGIYLFVRFERFYDNIDGIKFAITNSKGIRYIMSIRPRKGGISYTPVGKNVFGDSEGSKEGWLQREIMKRNTNAVVKSDYFRDKLKDFLKANNMSTEIFDKNVRNYLDL